MSSAEKPNVIYGGCLCESVRYTVTFPPDHDFAKAVSTCQCTQCRKNNGTLYLHSHSLPASAVNFTSQGTLQRYYATPPNARGFCGRCGGFLFFESQGGSRLSLAVGNFDEEDLKRYGTVLTKPSRHLFCTRDVPGVTDHFKGERWKGDNEGEDAELMPDSGRE